MVHLVESASVDLISCEVKPPHCLNAETYKMNTKDDISIGYSSNRGFLYSKSFNIKSGMI